MLMTVERARRHPVLGRVIEENPEVFFVSINASKQKDHPFIDEYKLFNTPTYVLINNKGEKIVRRVGTFNPTYFKKYLA